VRGVQLRGPDSAATFHARFSARWPALAGLLLGTAHERLPGGPARPVRRRRLAPVKRWGWSRQFQPSATLPAGAGGGRRRTGAWCGTCVDPAGVGSYMAGDGPAAPRRSGGPGPPAGLCAQWLGSARPAGAAPPEHILVCWYSDFHLLATGRALGAGLGGASTGTMVTGLPASRQWGSQQRLRAFAVR